MSRPSLARIGLIGVSSLFLMLSGCGGDSDCMGSSCTTQVGGGTVASTAGKSSVATGGRPSSGAGGATAAESGGISSNAVGGTSASAGGESSSAAGGATLETTGGAPTSTGGSTAGATGGAATGGATPITSGGSSSPAAGGTAPDSSGGAISTGGASVIATGGTDATATSGSTVVATGGSATNTTGGTAAQPTGGTTSSDAGGSPSSGGTDANTTGGTTDISTGGASTGGQTGSDVILKYDFEDGTGTVVTDTSGNSMNGTLVDADWTANTDGRNGIAGEFVNADSAVALPNDVFAGASELTVTAWVFMTDNQQWNHLFDIGTGTDNDLYFTFNNENGGMELGLRLNGNAPQTLFTTTMLPLNVWKHVAITLSSKGAFMYVDGREVARAAGLVISPSVLGVTTSNWIGKSQFPYPEFSGRIDEFYMYKRALTKSEIAMLAWPKLDYSIWHFDETSGTVAHDSSDNARDGTLVNGTWTAGAFDGAVQLYNPSGVSAPSANDQYVQLPNGILKNCSQGYTVAAWINIAAVFNHQRIFNFGNDAGHFIAARTKGGMTQQLALDNNTSGTETYANINFTWATGTWYHVATVRDGQTLKVFLNGSTTGVASATNTVTAAMPTADTLGDTPYNYVGRAMPTATDSRMHGFVDEFLVSCRPFTADEIMQLAYLPPS